MLNSKRFIGRLLRDRDFQMKAEQDTKVSLFSLNLQTKIEERDLKSCLSITLFKDRTGVETKPFVQHGNFHIQTKPYTGKAKDTKSTESLNAALILQIYSIHFGFQFHIFFLQQFAGKHTYALIVQIYSTFLFPMPQFFPTAIQLFSCNLTRWKMLL